jgi:hypothetical protein
VNNPAARQAMLRVPAPAPGKALPQNWAQAEAARIVQRARQEIADERQAEREAAGQCSARYATHREVAGAFVAQPFPAVPAERGGQRAGGPPWWEQGSRTVAVDLTGAAAEVIRPRSRFITDWRTLARFRDTCRIVGFSAAMKRGDTS